MTYTPSLDRILPPPKHLHVKIKNTSAIPLRAAYLHGPYTLYVATYPSTFDANTKFSNTEQEGEPDYEPQLKAGGHWSSKLTIPDEVRQDATAERDAQAREPKQRKSFTWVIEVASQVLFSTTAAVHFELVVGRDEKSVSFGFNGVVSGHGVPGKLEDHELGNSRNAANVKGVFTKAVKLRVDDTTSLWNTPAFPEDDEDTKKEGARPEKDRPKHKRKPKRIHLVLVTHGLHSNLGADMLYMKESIDAAAKKAKEDSREHRRQMREKKAKQENSFGNEAIDRRTVSMPDVAIARTHPAQDDEDDDEDEEDVIVRGFSGNACKTERGIQYLGKRLAKYVLSMTYPDQPYLPVKSSITHSISRTFTNARKSTDSEGKKPAHKGSTIAKDEKAEDHDMPYTITSISFVGHSLGGLCQTYAIAYIQKHSPGFFDKIKPINFVALASPFLGLSNENPMYVKFALDFGLVGRTGQDLGLTWRAPTIARNGWGAMVGGFGGGDNTKEKQPDPGAKPLLRILPTGPAHIALKKFRNRSVYSNVVNDGIVPLRTSCLLFLDWRGLGRVEKARRENGLVGTMVNWGLNEITGQNASTPRRGFFEDLFADSGDDTKVKSPRSPDPASAVPQAEVGQGLDKERYNDSDDESAPNKGQTIKRRNTSESVQAAPQGGAGLWSTFTNFFRPQAGTPARKVSGDKKQRMYRRGQTMGPEGMDTSPPQTSLKSRDSHDSFKSGDGRKLLVRGSSLYNEDPTGQLEAPPRTTVFESAGDLLNPPLPPKEFILDPEARARTIFHDRVYHPEDIPPPPVKRSKTFMRRPSSSEDKDVPVQPNSDLDKISSGTANDAGTIRIEEKIARAYHKDMAWRKVLVRLEPDAHNNIIVRRMFANAYGWPVVKHMCDTHFAYTAAAKTGDDLEPADERARPADEHLKANGEAVKDQTKSPSDNQIKRLKSDENDAAKSEDNFPKLDDEEISVLRERQQKLSKGQNLSTKAATQLAQSRQTLAPPSPTGSRDHRSPSELRESRDELPDLVSMISAQGEPSHSYSSMHSGTAALQRLTRSDSGRWSDKFFEGSEDESEEDDGLDAELNRAFDRGERMGVSGSGSPKFTASPRSSSRGPAAQQARGRSPLGRTILNSEDVSENGDEIVFAEEPDSYASRRSSAQQGVMDMVPDPQILSLTGVGLGKTPSELVMDAPSSPARTRRESKGKDTMAHAQPESSAQSTTTDQAISKRTSTTDDKQTTGHGEVEPRTPTKQQHNPPTDAEGLGIVEQVAIAATSPRSAEEERKEQ